MLLDRAGTVGGEQARKVFDALQKRFADVRICNAFTGVRRIDGLLRGVDIHLGTDRLVDRHERIVARKDHVLRVVDQRIARDARCGLVCLRHAAVDDEDASVRLDRGLALLDLDRHVSVDDVRIGIVT